jgi:hypothetical protein
MNNFLYYSLYYFIIIIILNIILYFINNRKLYLFSLNIERMILLNGRCIHYIMFKNIYSIFNWRSEKYFKVMLNVLLQYLADVYGSVDNIYLSIIFFDFDPKTNIHRVISDPCFINFNLSQNINVEDLYDLLNFNEIAFSNNSNNIIIVIKTI